jgi:hypothetical protein
LPGRKGDCGTDSGCASEWIGYQNGSMTLRFQRAPFGALVLAAFALTCFSCSDGGSESNPQTGGSGGMTTAGKSGAGGATAGTSNGGSGGSAAGSGGVSGGAGGTAGGTTGGSSAAGTAGVAGTGGAGGTGGGGGAVVACPADATFCADFETPGLPTKAVYKVNAAPGEWTRDFEIDAVTFRNGKGALKVKVQSDASSSGSAYRMLAVPAPADGAFWARFYIRQQDLDIGESEHNAFAGAANTDEPNSSVMIELAEDVGFALNTSDDVRWPVGFGRIQGNPMPYKLAKGMWHCVEISYDGNARMQKVYVGGVEKINATDYPKSIASPLKFFKFGFNSLHGPARDVWYDDVAVGPTRPGCPPAP